MKLTKENFNKVFNFIDDQVNDEVFGQFDKETDILKAVKMTIEQIEESNELPSESKRNYSLGNGIDRV
tara:strand:+ start:2043 stop:2246 length:204 start_codon:yes stop_codon:yes gene_type:complete